MFSLRPFRRLYTATNAAAAVSTHIPNPKSHILNPKPVDKPAEPSQPALVKLKNERDPHKLFHLFKANAQNRLVVENRFAFEDTVHRLAGARRFDYIEDLLEHQKTLPQGRREGFIVRIIMLYGRAGMTKHAVETFYSMHQYGCSRTVKSFNAALKVLTQTRDLEAIHSFLYEVPEKFSISLDAFSLNIVVNAICEAGFLEKAYLIMIEMEKVGIRADVITYTTLISFSYKKNQCVIANGLWNLMVRRGCLPNLTTFNVRIQYLVEKRKAWEANRVMAIMRSIGISPDEVTFNLVIKGFCQTGKFEMAKNVYSALHDQGHKPNSKIYQTMIHYLCKAGQIDSAYKFCKDSMDKNWFPSVVSIYKLLEGLMKNSKDRKAKEIMMLVRRRVPPYSVAELKAFEHILTRPKD